MIAALATGSRKVRTPQGRVVGNAHPGQPAGKCHRKQTAGVQVPVRVKRWCKRPPAFRVTGAARQTPPGARSRGWEASASCLRRRVACSMSAGRPHETVGNGSPRWMITNALSVRRGRGSQDPAYRPTRPPSARRTAFHFKTSSTKNEVTVLGSATAVRPQRVGVERRVTP